MAKKPDITEKPSAEQAGSLPLFFSKPQPLDAKRHAKATVKPTNDFTFARATNSIPLNAIEFLEAAKSYPIVFTNEENPVPTAIVGMEQTNTFIAKDKQWLKNAYIPAYVRQYPFVFFERPEEDKFYLCIDEAAPHYSDNKAEGASALYNDDKPSDLTNNALQFCTAFYNHHNITKNFCADLKANNLLTSYKSEARLPSGKTLNLAGFQIIDEQAFNALPEKTFLEFRKKGWLAFIYFALASTTNWKRLVDLAIEQSGESKAA